MLDQLNHMLILDSAMIHAVQKLGKSGENFQNTNFIKNGTKKRWKSTFSGCIH